MSKQTSAAGGIRVWLVTGIALAALFLGCVLHYLLGTYSYTAAQGGFAHVTGLDDAYIGYRYGWNLVHFNTLSWNESGFRRTEGFTDPLWVYMSALWSLPADKTLVYPGMVLTSTLLTAAIVAGLCGLALKNIGSFKGLVGILLFCASPVVWLHTTSGLESAVFGVVIGLLAFSCIVDAEVGTAAFWSGNVLALFAILLRSDGFVYVLVLALGLALAKPRKLKMIVPGGVIAVLVLLIWGEMSFGLLWPNTAYAKLNFGFAARSLTGAVLFIQSMGNGGLVFLVCGLFGLLTLPKAARLAGAVTIAGWCAYYVYIGGDLFLERHLIGLMALCAALSGFFFGRVLQDARGWSLAALLLVALYIPFFIRDPRFLYTEPKPRDSWVLIGQEMAKQRETYGAVVTFGAGKIPFFAGGDFVDELGLNDPQLAQVQRPRFIPGHSAGSHELALEIARRASPAYSYVAFNLDLTPNNAQDVLLWAANYSPQALVNHGVTAAQRADLMSAGPFDYSLIFRGR